MIELEKLVEKTVDFMKSTNVFVLKITGNSPRKPSSRWGSICLACIGKYDFKQSFKIYTKWKRNTKNYRTLVYQRLNEDDMETEGNRSILLKR